MSSLAAQIHDLVQSHATDTIASQIRSRLNSQYPDAQALYRAESSTQIRSGRSRQLGEEIAIWEARESKAKKELERTTEALPGLLQDTRDALQDLLSSAQKLSLDRHTSADKLAVLIRDTSETESAQGQSALAKLDALQDELADLEAGLSWVTILEKTVILGEAILDTANHRPFPLSVLPKHRELYQLVKSIESTLPHDMGLVAAVVRVREHAWEGLKSILSQKLIDACESIGWPKKVIYEEVPAQRRLAFEQAFQDLLYLQSEYDGFGENLRSPHWTSGKGLYALQAMAKPIELRFKYHFMGARGTNRVDKPEWAFANILDQIYTHNQFLATYLQKLANSSGYSISIASEFTLVLFPILLSLLRTRIPRLLGHPSLLAHTIYQTAVFDDAIRLQAFDLKDTSLSEEKEAPLWEGLVGAVLREENWFESWLSGEKQFATTRLNEIISSPDAWFVSDEREGEDLRSVVSARQVKGLVEQIVDRYSPLPDLSYKLPFLLTIQLPILANYLARISSSLEAFENVSSAFMKTVPGALTGAGNTMSGATIDQRSLTSGKAGLDKLIKAYLASKWMEQVMESWGDSTFFAEMTRNLQTSVVLKWKIQSEPLLPQSIKSSTIEEKTTVFDVLIQQSQRICQRAEDMIVKLVTVEVEDQLRQHLTRQWNQPPSSGPSDPSSHLLAALTTYISHLSTLLSIFPSLVTSRIYRRIVNNLSRHIMQRAVYAGWSKFSERGGLEFKEEITEWVEATRQVFVGYFTEGIWNVPYDAPWTKLVHVARILSLPTSSSLTPESGNEEPTFAQAMAVAWGETVGLDDFERILGIDVGRDELQRVLRRRLECWR
nr:hypothetical protein L204_06360 [Cryptococcus depauperatus CBS 7855]